MPYTRCAACTLLRLSGRRRHIHSTEQPSMVLVSLVLRARSTQLSPVCSMHVPPHCASVLIRPCAHPLPTTLQVDKSHCNVGMETSTYLGANLSYSYEACGFANEFSAFFAAVQPTPPPPSRPPSPPSLPPSQPPTMNPLISTSGGISAVAIVIAVVIPVVISVAVGATVWWLKKRRSVKIIDASASLG